MLNHSRSDCWHNTSETHWKSALWGKLTFTVFSFVTCFQNEVDMRNEVTWTKHYDNTTKIWNFVFCGNLTLRKLWNTTGQGSERGTHFQLKLEFTQFSIKGPPREMRLHEGFSRVLGTWEMLNKSWMPEWDMEYVDRWMGVDDTERRRFFATFPGGLHSSLG